MSFKNHSVLTFVSADPAMILSALALNYPHGTVGNLRILQKRCADLLLLADEMVPAAPNVKYAASI